jgi:hypothetical protein
MQLAEFRRDVVAPALNRTDDGLRVLQQRLYRNPTLAADGMRGRRGAPGDSGLVATPSAAAMLLLAGLANRNEAGVAERVAQLWTARYSPAGEVCAVTRVAAGGKALAKLLVSPDLCEKLECLEIVDEVASLRLVWDDGTHSTFASSNKPEWQRSMKKAMAQGPLHVTRFLGPELQAIALLLKRDAAAGAV